MSGFPESLHSKLSRRVQFRAENLVGSVITGFNLVQGRYLNIHRILVVQGQYLNIHRILVYR